MPDSTYTTLIACPPRTDMNTGLSAARHSAMLDALGRPGPIGRDCCDSSELAASLKRLVETRNVGPFRVTGLKPALDSLAAIFQEAHTAVPGLYSILGTEGMLCCRAVRGSTTFYSNHSWGTAVDITVGGLLPEMNASRIPSGFVVLYPYFHRHGWFWGAGYNGRTDPMHFEVADETIRKWKTDGLLS